MRVISRKIGGFADFAGAGVVHIAGGAAALACVLGAGLRTHAPQAEEVHPVGGTATPWAVLSAGMILVCVMILHSAMLGQMREIADFERIGVILTNTLIAASGGLAAALILKQIIYNKVQLTSLLAGMVGGCVAISGDPLSPALWQALMIGAVGGIIVIVAPPFLDRFRIDDAAGAISAHFFAGLWGTLVVAWTNPSAGLIGQAIGALLIMVFAFGMSLLIWTMLRYTFGVRLVAHDAVLLDRE